MWFWKTHGNGRYILILTLYQYKKINTNSWGSYFFFPLFCLFVRNPWARATSIKLYNSNLSSRLCVPPEFPGLFLSSDHLSHPQRPEVWSPLTTRRSQRPARGSPGYSAVTPPPCRSGLAWKTHTKEICVWICVSYLYKYICFCTTCFCSRMQHFNMYRAHVFCKINKAWDFWVAYLSCILIFSPSEADKLRLMCLWETAECFLSTQFNWS